MLIKEENSITWMPPLRDNEHGWLVIDKQPWLITSWHHFDDFGQSLETVTARSPQGHSDEFYSLDDGLNWTDDLD